MQNLKVTIVTATHNLVLTNRVETFKQTVQSVSMQDYKNYEHLIVDGGSTDGTLDILKDYAKQGLISYISEKDTGIYNAYNKGIKKSTGDIVAFLNSDDLYIRNDAISLAVRALEESRADFTYSDEELIFLNGDHCKYRQCSIANFPFHMLGGHPTVFARKFVFDMLHGFDEKYKIASDYDFMMRAIFNKFLPCKVDAVFVKYRLGGISNTDTVLCDLEYREILKKILSKYIDDAESFVKKRYIPDNVLELMLNDLNPFLDKRQVVLCNKKRFYKFIKREIFTFRLSKKRKTVKLFGITFYNNDPKIV